MRRRALLAGLGAVAAGCTSGYAPPGGDENSGTPTDPSLRNCPTPTPAETPDATPADAELRIDDLSVTSTTDGPDHRYVLEPDAFYSAAAVQREAARERYGNGDTPDGTRNDDTPAAPGADPESED